MSIINAFFASALIALNAPEVDTGTQKETSLLHLANPGEWIHVRIEPVEGETRPIYEIWDAVLQDNGFYQIAVPLKSGNRSVRHVAYNPKTKKRLKYHILFDLGYRFKMQFEEYDNLDSADKIDIKFDMQRHGNVDFDFIPPDYCITGASQATFKRLEAETKQSLMQKNGCDPKSYGN